MEQGVSEALARLPNHLAQAPATFCTACTSTLRDMQPYSPLGGADHRRGHLEQAALAWKSKGSALCGEIFKVVRSSSSCS